MLDNEAPNLMKCIETSLEVTRTSALIESIDLPIHTQMITFRSDIATLNQEQIQNLALKSLPEKELIGYF